MQESTFTNYDQLPLFLNANTVAQVHDKIPSENHQQQKSCYGDHKFRIKLRLQLG